MKTEKSGDICPKCGRELTKLDDGTKIHFCITKKEMGKKMRELNKVLEEE